MRRSSCGILSPSAPGSTSWTRWPGTSLLARKLDEEGEPFASAWNFGPEDIDARTGGLGRPAILRASGARERPTGSTRGEHPHEAHHLKLDISKAKDALGLASAAGTFASAIDRVVEWTRRYRDGGDVP